MYADKTMKIVVRCLEALILIVVMIGFLIIFSIASYFAWGGKIDGEIYELNDAALYIATTLAGFIMAFFANRMGVDLEAIGQRLRLRDKADDKADIEKSFKKHCEDNKILYFYDNFYNDLGYLETKKTIGSLYMIMFFVVALTAIVTWVVAESTPDVIKNVACISVSLFIGVAKNVLDTV